MICCWLAFALPATFFVFSPAAFFGILIKEDARV